MAKKRVALYIDPELQQEISLYADKMGISHNQLMNNLLISAMSDLKFLEKCGVLAIGVGLRELADKFKRGELKGDNLTRVVL